MLLWSPLSLLGNYRFSRTSRPNEDAFRREEEEQKEEEKEEEEEEENVDNVILLRGRQGWSERVYLVGIPPTLFSQGNIRARNPVRRFRHERTHALKVDDIALKKPYRLENTLNIRWVVGLGGALIYVGHANCISRIFVSLSSRYHVLGIALMENRAISFVRFLNII